jgi:uncharacterized membrane protein
MLNLLVHRVTRRLIKLIKGISKKLNSDKDKTVFSRKVLVVVCLVIVFMSMIAFISFIRTVTASR